MTNETDSPQTPAPPPRAFAQGTGVLLQTVGVAMFLSSCCICSVSGLWDPAMSRGQVIEQIEQKKPIAVTLTTLRDNPGQAGIMLTVMFTTIGGLALAGFGLGLQSDRRRSAWGALAATLLLLAVLILAGVCLWVGQAAIVTRLWHAVLTLVMFVLTVFCAIALRQVHQNPPPPGPEVLPDDFELPPGHF